jgi:hypothetical protein
MLVKILESDIALLLGKFQKLSDLFLKKLLGFNGVCGSLTGKREGEAALASVVTLFGLGVGSFFGSSLPSGYGNCFWRGGLGSGSCF